ncbi:hypothetical protein B9J07_13590 [Sinorhizobium sp. LM21]|nr:hypothetical protein B9J07_13590 [Sinorhizobium sp. LM21]
MDIAAQLSDIKQSLNGLHQKGAKSPKFAQAMLLRACADMARRAGNHHLAMSLVHKAAAQPAMTSVAGWASELVGTPAAQLILMASARSAFAQIMTRSNQIGILGATQQSVTVLGSPPAARFVAEGDPAPVTQGSLSGLPISPKKISGIVGFTGEQAKRSNIVNVARQLLTESLAKGLDAAAFTDQPPFGLFQGVTPTVAEADPLNDTKALLAAMTEPSPDVVFVMNTARWPIFLESVGQSFPFASFPSSTVGDELVAIDPAGVAGAISGGEIDTTTEAVLHMDDQPGPVIASSPTRSLWQTDTMAMKIAADMAWKARPGAVAFIQSVSW